MSETYLDETTQKTVSRLEAALQHLEKHVLNDILLYEQEFTLVRFDREYFTQEPVLATPSSVKEALGAASKWHADGSTDVWGVLHRAYSDEQARAVYLLSDGDASDRTSLINAVRGWSTNGSVPCNTICLYGQSRGDRLMASLSEVSGGLATVVSGTPAWRAADYGG
jgi:hypothetical protein